MHMNFRLVLKTNKKIPFLQFAFMYYSSSPCPYFCIDFDNSPHRCVWFRLHLLSIPTDAWWLGGTA